MSLEAGNFKLAGAGAGADAGAGAGAGAGAAAAAAAAGVGESSKKRAGTYENRVAPEKSYVKKTRWYIWKPSGA